MGYGIWDTGYGIRDAGYGRRDMEAGRESRIPNLVSRIPNLVSRTTFLFSITLTEYIMSYKNLEVWQLAREVVIEVHKMTMNLPKFELFEEGQQIRRSTKTTKSTIVEGYGRRRYKSDFIKFLVYAHSSNDESVDHLETLFETGSLTEEALYLHLQSKMDILGRKLNKLIQAVEAEHISVK
jgi:four helix bundle protein